MPYIEERILIPFKCPCHGYTYRDKSYCLHLVPGAEKLKLQRIDWADRTNAVMELYEERLKVMRHWRAGGNIEFRMKDGFCDTWFSFVDPMDPSNEPVWDWDKSEYRIKQ